MLDLIAREARRWTRGLDVELALVAPVRCGEPQPVFGIALGLPGEVRVDPQRVFRVALAASADAVVLAHNHPGDAPPSAADGALTRRLVADGAMLGVPLLAHLVVTSHGWYDCVKREASLIRWNDIAA